MSEWTKIVIAVGSSLVVVGSIGVGLYFGMDRPEPPLASTTPHASATTSLTTSTTTALVTTGKTTTTTTMSTTSTVLQPAADPILAIWGGSPTKALVTNGNGDVVDIEWGNEGDVNGQSNCAIEHKNQFFILGQVSLNFSLFYIFESIKLLKPIERVTCC